MTKTIKSLLVDLKRAAGIHERLRLEHFIKFSEVFCPSGDAENIDDLWEGLKNALIKALDCLNKMRAKEGKALKSDILSRISDLNEHVDSINQIAKDNLDETYSKMISNVQGLLGQCELEKERLYTELAILSSKVDVTEECVRLKSHNQLFIEIIQKEREVGKKLNFILQEMNREVNTISSKACNTEISHLVVIMKEEIEKLREQVQNLE